MFGDITQKDGLASRERRVLPTAEAPLIANKEIGTTNNHTVQYSSGPCTYYPGIHHTEPVQPGEKQKSFFACFSSLLVAGA